MGIRIQRVKLAAPKYEMEQLFEISHAERILAMGEEANGGWTLPEDSKYIYTKENGIRLKPSIESAQKAD
jgi:hypothetical protein